MFRRPGKNPLEEDNALYQEETSLVSPYKYGTKKEEASSPLFDTAHQSLASPMSTSMKEREESWDDEKTTPLPHPFQGMMNEEDPETTLGEGVAFRGELSFERLLRIDGTFEGDLLSEGKVIIGPKGKVKANLNLREAIIEGELKGNVTVQEKLELRGAAFVEGDICAKILCVDEGVRIIGYVCVDSDPTKENPKESSS